MLLFDYTNRIEIGCCFCFVVFWFYWFFGLSASYSNVLCFFCWFFGFGGFGGCTTAHSIGKSSIRNCFVTFVTVCNLRNSFHNFRNYYIKTGDVEIAVNETLRSAGRALITTTLILVCCFWLRLFSPLKVISDFGLIMGFSLLVAFLADVMLAPALLSAFYGGSNTGSQNKAADSAGS